MPPVHMAAVNLPADAGPLAGSLICIDQSQSVSSSWGLSLIYASMRVCELGRCECAGIPDRGNGPHDGFNTRHHHHHHHHHRSMQWNTGSRAIVPRESALPRPRGSSCGTALAAH